MRAHLYVLNFELLDVKVIHPQERDGVLDTEAENKCVHKVRCPLERISQFPKTKNSRPYLYYLREDAQRAFREIVQRVSALRLELMYGRRNTCTQRIQRQQRAHVIMYRTNE